MNCINMTRKSGEHLRATYGNMGQLFQPYYRFYCLALEVPLFLENADRAAVCRFGELWPCARTHLKRPCATLVQLGGQLTNTVWSPRFALTSILKPQGAIPLGSNPLWRGWVYRLVPEAPLFSRMPMEPGAFLE